MRISEGKATIQSIDDCYDCINKGSCAYLAKIKQSEHDIVLIIEDCNKCVPKKSMYNPNHQKGER